MRFILPLLFVFSPLTLIAQSSPEWQRVYTFDDSTIEMNTSLVTRIDNEITRVRFRWMFHRPEPLPGAPDLKYRSQLEVMEFKCSVNQYRTYHLTFVDQAGNAVRVQDSPGEWRTIVSNSMMQKLIVPACELIKGKIRAETRPHEIVESAQMEKAALYAYEVARQLERTKDFQTVIDRFFVAEYLDSYLNDDQTNWFLNLSRDTATKTKREELRRFYVAMMNAGYLTSLYLISQSASDATPVEKLLPPDILALLNNHQYQTRKDADGFLAETIHDAEQLRSYTDLLEKLSSLMRTHVKRVGAEHDPKWKAMLEEWNLYQPKLRVCSNDCLGLPKGTRIFTIDVPVFQLQLTEISGQLKIVSAMSRFR